MTSQEQWEYDEDEQMVKRCGTGKWVCCMTEWDGPKEEMDRAGMLIAAAPDMLRALEAIESCTLQGCERCRGLLDDALKKARGET